MPRLPVANTWNLLKEDEKKNRIFCIKREKKNSSSCGINYEFD